MDSMLGVIIEGAAGGRTELARRAQHAKVRLPEYRQRLDTSSADESRVRRRTVPDVSSEKGPGRGRVEAPRMFRGSESGMPWRARKRGRERGRKKGEGESGRDGGG